jgi:hypothetical protein
MLLFSVGNGAMNASRCWQLRDDACGDVEASVNTPRFSNLCSSLGIRIQIANSCTRLRGIFKGLDHRMGDRPIFFKTSAPHSLMMTYRMNLL